MSYRIHINICKKIDWLNYLKEYSVNKDEDDCIYLPKVKSNICAEICDNTPIDGFTKVDCEEEEYHPYILDKADFREVLKSYQDMQIELHNNRIVRVDKIRFKKYKSLMRKKFELRRFFMILWSYAFWSKDYFEGLKNRDVLITDSDRFEYQYFYLVGLYESFNDNEDVLVITHG